MRTLPLVALLLLFQSPLAAAELDVEDHLDLLYQPAESLAVDPGEVVFFSHEFIYRFDPGTEGWSVESRKKPRRFADARTPIESFEDETGEVQYQFVFVTNKDEARLEIHRSEDNRIKRIADLFLYDRWQAARLWQPHYSDVYDTTRSERAVSRSIRPSKPWVADLAVDGRNLWLALASVSAPESLGVATLVKLDLVSLESEIFQPEELVTSSFTRILVADRSLWLATSHLGVSGEKPTAGLVRYNPFGGALESYLPETSDLVGRLVKAMDAGGLDLWVTTDRAICRLRFPAIEWTCWRLVPEVVIKQPIPVSSRPGGKKRRDLNRGSYPVRWITPDSLQVVTSDAVEGWLSPEILQRLKTREQRQYSQDSLPGEGISAEPLLLAGRPHGVPGEAAVVFRIPYRRLALRSGDGWQLVRIHAGWIAAEGLDVIPTVVRVDPEEENEE